MNRRKLPGWLASMPVNSSRLKVLACEKSASPASCIRQSEA
jgi:hypothetical protein